MNAYLSGVESNEGYLNHSLVPRPDPGLAVVELPKITDVTQAQNYARKAFHESVSHGLSASGKLRDIWADAARQYAMVYESIIGLPADYGLSFAKTDLTAANATADRAYAYQAPNAGVPATAEQVKSTKTGKGVFVVGVLAALVGWGLFSSKQAKKRTQPRLAGLLSGG